MKTQISGININYESVTGKAQSKYTALLLHGWGGSMESLRSLFQMLSEKMDVYVIDLPGFGQSEYPVGAWKVEDYSSLVQEFIKDKKLKNLIFVGHSFGGAIGIDMEASKPGTFEKMVLMAPAFYRDPKVAVPATLVRKYLPFYSSLKSRVPISSIRRLYYSALYPGSDYLRNEKLQDTFREIIKQDLRPQLPKLDGKEILLLWGDKDNYTPIWHAKYLTDAVKSCKFIKYEGAGHGLPLREPKWVFEQIKTFLKI